MLPYLGFIITMGSCYRLAVFNIDTRQTNSFIGFDSCQCTVYFKFTLSVKIFGFFNCSRNPDKPMGFVNNHTFSAYILNAEIPLFSLKIKSLISRITHYKLASCCFLLLLFSICGIPLVIICYVVLSIVSNKFY
jgi:CDP-diacylglycerol--serine O-phosphatidyltransferase